MQYPRAYRFVRKLYFTAIAAGLCVSGLLYLARPWLSKTGDVKVIILRAEGTPFRIRLPQGRRITCRLPGEAEANRCGLILRGTSSFKAGSYPATVEAISGGVPVAVFHIERPGPFRISFSLHLLPENTDTPIRLTLRPLQASEGIRNWSISSSEGLTAENRPARTVKELLASPEPLWYPREIPELLEEEDDRCIAAARELSLARDRRGLRALSNAYRKRWALYLSQVFFDMGDTAVPDLIGLYRHFMAEGNVDGATKMLWTIREPIAHDFLKGLLKNRDRRVAVFSAGCLSIMGDDSGVPVALEGLEDPDPVVRADACWAIGKSRDQNARQLAYPVALTGLDSPNGYARGQSKHALSNLRFREALPLYLEWLESEDPGTRLHGVTGIARLGDPALAPHLIEALRNEKNVDSCLVILDFMPSEGLTGELIDIIKSKNSEAVRLKIIRRLERAGPEIAAELRGICHGREA